MGAKVINPCLLSAGVEDNNIPIRDLPQAPHVNVSGVLKHRQRTKLAGGCIIGGGAIPPLIHRHQRNGKLGGDGVQFFLQLSQATKLAAAIASTGVHKIPPRHLRLVVAW